MGGIIIGMNKSTLFVVGGIVLLMAGAFAYLLLVPAKKEDMPTTTSQTSKTKEAPKQPVEPAPQTPQPGEYVSYSKDAVLSTPDTKLLFFHAPWCPQCRQIESDIQKEGVPDGVTVFKVDYDTNQQLRQQYGVTLQTTFVKIDDKGVKIASYVAYKEPTFDSVKRELLK